MTHTPNEHLMQRILSELSAEPRSIHRLHQATEPKRTRKEIRQALFDLMHYGKVAKCFDGCRWELVCGGSEK